MLDDVLRSASVVGFSGTRNAEIESEIYNEFILISGVVPDNAEILVGCAKGIDEWVRQCFPCEIFSVASGAWGRGRGAFAARSVAFVRSLASRGGLLLSFPALGSVPAAGLVPSSSSSRCFSGGGSGSWASLAFAIGSGVPCFVFLGSGSAPAGWGLVPAEGWDGWFEFAPAGVQLALF